MEPPPTTTAGSGAADQTPKQTPAGRKRRRPVASGLTRLAQIPPEQRAKLTLRQIAMLPEPPSTSTTSTSPPPSTSNPVPLPPPPPMSEDPAALAAAPQLKLVDGKFVLDQSSLRVAAGEERLGHDTTANYDVVDEGTGGMFGTGTTGVNRKLWSRRKDSMQLHRWTQEETHSLLRALRTYGTDFTMITAAVFPGRDRRQVKAKFKRMERDFPRLVDLALTSKIPLDPEKLREAGLLEDEGHTDQQTSAGVATQDEGDPLAQVLSATTSTTNTNTTTTTTAVETPEATPAKAAEKAGETATSGDLEDEDGLF